MIHSDIMPLFGVVTGVKDFKVLMNFIRNFLSFRHHLRVTFYGSYLVMFPSIYSIFVLISFA